MNDQHIDISIHRMLKGGIATTESYGERYVAGSRALREVSRAECGTVPGGLQCPGLDGIYSKEQGWEALTPAHPK